MGIPKFFRWMSERYPGLLTTARENQLPEIDNFYLDMNGIIHNCTHPCDGDVHFRISEEEMFEDIFNYINTLFKIIKPREFFFMAVDGVAPRAKMNQQRGRRFRSAKEAIDREDAALKKGDILPNEQRFDSNCITPGTQFMVKLHKALQEFIQLKLATDPEWQHVKVILSGHETPGEGEHKVMDFIRYQRSQSNYNPNTRHCLYGLDTDLIMLGLSSHEPNFMLLREEIKFSSRKSEATKGKSQRVDPTKISFNVLYLSRLRDYIEEDFLPLKSKMMFKFDLEAIIDDWILICFLIGNDFIPHIPHFHIHKNALPTIFEVYQATLTKLDGYLNEKGILNLKRFKTFAKALSIADFENYKNLVKDNGGECARDDFSKLNMFVKQKFRIAGIRDNSSSYRKTYTRTGNNNDNSHPTNHSYNHTPDVWYNIQSRNQHKSISNGQSANYTPNRSLHTKTGGQQTHSSTPNKINGNVSSKLNQNSSSNNNNNNAPNGSRVGVHSFTEEQINNSITVCADGDFIDLSDDEYLSDEKFPGEKPLKPRKLKNGTVVVVKRGVISTSSHLNNSNRRSTPKKELRNNKATTNESASKKPSTDMDYFEAYKRTYYHEKLKLNPTKKSILKVVHEYVRALQWNLHYYYHGCISWGWFYPYHYAPFISDVANFEDIDTIFELGQPFKPFDQLLSVLPAASSALLPNSLYRSLVTSDSSPLAKYFPTEVEYDLNGKQNDWEAVVLAPFIDEEALLKASVLCNLFLTEEERNINNHGPHLLYYYVGPKSSNKYSEGNQRRQPPPLRDRVSAGSVKCELINLNGFLLPRDKIKYGLLRSDFDNMLNDIGMKNNHHSNYKMNASYNNNDHRSSNNNYGNNNNSYNNNGNNIGYRGNHNNNSNSYQNGNGHNNRASNNHYHQNNRRVARINL